MGGEDGRRRTEDGSSSACRAVAPRAEAGARVAVDVRRRARFIFTEHLRQREGSSHDPASVEVPPSGRDKAALE
jgi:hypothetical protein